MNYRPVLWSGAGLGLVASLVALLVIGWASEHGQVRILEAEQHRFCQRQATALGDAVSGIVIVGGRSHPDYRGLRDAMKLHFLDQAALGLCVGSDVPVDTSDAAMCWIGHGVDDCYAQAASRLLSLYRAKGYR